MLYTYSKYFYKYLFSILGCLFLKRHLSPTLGRRKDEKTEFWPQGSPSLVGGWGTWWVGKTESPALAVQCDSCICTGTSSSGAPRLQTMVGRILGGCEREGDTGWIQKSEDVNLIIC